MINLNWNTMNAEEKLVTALGMAMTAPTEAASNEWAEEAAELAKAVPGSNSARIRELAWAKADEIRASIDQGPQSQVEALEMALYLAITAPTEAKAAQAMAMAEDFVSGLTDDEISAAKSAAQARAFGPTTLANVVAAEAAEDVIARASKNSRSR
jgi:hypothetical protein